MLVFSFATITNAHAESVNSGNSTIGPRAVTIHYKWKIISKKRTGTGNGGWRNGPSGRGPAKLTLSNSNSANRTFTNTISGKYPVGKGEISSSLGVSIGKTVTHGTSYSINIPKKTKRQIIFRSVYRIYTIKQEKYEVIGGYSEPTHVYETAKVHVFDHWYYSWKTIK
ncbi:hypothetical protein QS257_05815 [Terrilactibacillus sp. S3-3]|nr:hypothetical protein QS257_05815 [Terrilactibacillus sp. S3-3]